MRITDKQTDIVVFWPHDTRTKWAMFTLATNRWIAAQRRGL